MSLCAPPSTILSPLHPSFPSRRGTRRAPTSKDFSQRNLVATKLDFDLTYPLHFLLFRSLHPSCISSFVASLASIPFILAFFLRVLLRSSYRCFSYSLHSSNFLSFILHLSSFFSTLSLFSAFEFLYTSPFILFLDASFLRCIRSISHLLHFTFHFHSNYYCSFSFYALSYILFFTSVSIITGFSSSFFSTLFLFTAFEFLILYTSSFILFLDASFLHCICSISLTFYFSLLFQLSLVSLHPFSRRFPCSVHSNFSFSILHLSSFSSMLFFLAAFAKFLILYTLFFTSIPITTLSTLFLDNISSLLHSPNFSSPIFHFHSTAFSPPFSSTLFFFAAFTEFPTLYLLPSFYLLFPLSFSFFRSSCSFSTLFLDAFLLHYIRRISHPLHFHFHSNYYCSFSTLFDNISSSLHSQNFSSPALYFSLPFQLPLPSLHPFSFLLCCIRRISHFPHFIFHFYFTLSFSILFLPPSVDALFSSPNLSSPTPRSNHLFFFPALILPFNPFRPPQIYLRVLQLTRLIRGRDAIARKDRPDSDKRLLAPPSFSPR